jgi:hypothetical protein
LLHIKGLWATPQTERFDGEEHTDKIARTTIRELMIYMVFIGILTIGKTKQKNIEN